MKGTLTLTPLPPRRMTGHHQTDRHLKFYIYITIPFSNNFKMSNSPSKRYGQFSSKSSPEKRMGIPGVEITRTGGKPPIKYPLSAIGYPIVLSTKERPALVAIIARNGPSSRTSSAEHILDHINIWISCCCYHSSSSFLLLLHHLLFSR
jgi:hypothetical protein